MGDYQPPRAPDEPIVVTLGGGMGGMERKSGMNVRDTFRPAREIMLQTTFETYERKHQDASRARARQRRLRPGARHRGDHDQLMAARLCDRRELSFRSRLAG
jgi:hypothetical protein